MVGTPLEIRIIGQTLPGLVCGPYRDVRVGLQVGKEITGLVAASAAQAEWQTVATVVPADGGALRVRGAAIHGGGGERFLYLSWVARGANGGDAMFRRAKLQLDGTVPELIGRALRTGKPLVAELGLTDDKGMPRCASVRPPAIRWSVGR